MPHIAITQPVDEITGYDKKDTGKIVDVTIAPWMLVCSNCRVSYDRVYIDRVEDEACTLGIRCVQCGCEKFAFRRFIP